LASDNISGFAHKIIKMRTFHFALTLCLLSLISAESSQNSVVDFVVTQIGDHERCREGHWLNVFPSSALECAYIVSNNPSCDNRYFSWANYNDNNCWCAEVGTDCKNNLASQNVVTTWEISTVTIEYQLVFRQTLPYLYAQNELRLNPENPSSDNYAILDELERFRREDGRFYFRMVWPGDDIVYEWSQTSNPVSESVEGYEAISVPFTGRYWGGLEPSTAALMDGSVNSGNWFYAVGSHRLWNRGIPSYAKANNDAGYPQQAVELYVKSPVESIDGSVRINKVRSQQCKINGHWGLTSINYGPVNTAEQCWEQISNVNNCNQKFFTWSPTTKSCFCYADLTATHHSCTQYVTSYGHETFEVIDTVNDFPGNILGGGWELVRRVQAGTSWHPANDQLQGTSAYGTFINDPTIDATFSVPYDIENVVEFLFATGDGTKWLVASKDAVTNGFYANEDRTIIASSTSDGSYTAKWYHRENHSEDPWISLTDHGGAIGSGEILYGANSFGYGHASNILPHHNGANVFVRYASSKVINYDDCTTIESVTGPHYEVDPEDWETTCPENTAVVSVETMETEPHNQYWSIAKMQCCPLVDKITGSQYRIPELIGGVPNYLQGGGSLSVEDQWEAQCPPNAVMVGIYDNDDNGDFDDIDATACNTLDCPYTCGEKIDNDDCVVVNISPYSLSSCPIDYVMVGLWDAAGTYFSRVRKMKCCRVLESIPPTVSPTQMPTTDDPSQCPTVSPTTSIPSMSPTTNEPTLYPSQNPTTEQPTDAPSLTPSTEEPSISPSRCPTFSDPTYYPSKSPSKSPTTDSPTLLPTISPSTDRPTKFPSTSPTTEDPSLFPTMPPSTDSPTKSPSQNPTTEEPTAFPSTPPTYAPTLCEPTCRSHADQMVNFLDLMLDFNTVLLESVEFRKSDEPLQIALDEMIMRLRRLKDHMNIVHDDLMPFIPPVH